MIHARKDYDRFQEPRGIAAKLEIIQALVAPAGDVMPDWDTAYKLLDKARAEMASLVPSPGSTTIGEDEPVCLFRAQDKFFLPVMVAYLNLLVLDNDCNYEDPMVKSVLAHMKLACEWQDEHGCKTPDLPEGA